MLQFKDKDNGKAILVFSDSGKLVNCISKKNIYKRCYVLKEHFKGESDFEEVSLESEEVSLENPSNPEELVEELETPEDISQEVPETTIESDSLEESEDLDEEDNA